MLAVSPRQRNSYSIKGLATKTTSLGRWHLNTALGTWSTIPVHTTSDTACTGVFRFEIVPASCLGNAPVIPDSPCDVSPTHTTLGSVVANPGGRMFCSSGASAATLTGQPSQCRNPTAGSG